MLRVRSAYALILLVVLPIELGINTETLSSYVPLRLGSRRVIQEFQGTSTHPFMGERVRQAYTERCVRIKHCEVRKPLFRLESPAFRYIHTRAVT